MADFVTLNSGKVKKTGGRFGGEYPTCQRIHKGESPSHKERRNFRLCDHLVDAGSDTILVSSQGSVHCVELCQLTGLPKPFDGTLECATDDGSTLTVTYRNGALTGAHIRTSNGSRGSGFGYGRDFSSGDRRRSSWR